MSSKKPMRAADDTPGAATQTLDVVTRLSHVVKKGLLKQRIYAASWSMIVFLAIQSYLTSTMSMATNFWLVAGVSAAYLAWSGLALWQIHQLNRQYEKKLAELNN
jgi:hypothetical protein